jgi:hypothetical protein
MNTPDTLHYLQWTLEAVAIFGPMGVLAWLAWEIYE